jgi:PAS domain S-box-containing protein
MRLSISTRLRLGCSAVAFLLIISGLVFYHQIRIINRDVLRIVEAAKPLDDVAGAIETNAREIVAAAKEARSSASVASVGVAVTVLLCAVIAGGVSWFTIGRIRESLTELAEGVDALSEGQLSHRVAIDSEDEIGRLGAAFNRMAERRERVEAENRRLAAAVEHAAETIVITDADGIMQYVNPAFEKSTGYTREEAIGKEASIVKSGEQDESFHENMWETIRRGEVWRGRFINKRKNGELYHEEATISPVRDCAGRITNYMGVRRDITHEIALEEHLRQAQKLEAVGTLASGIAHDFNNLLTAIFGYTDLAKATLPSGHQALKALDMVEQTARQAQGVTRSLLTFTRKTEATKVPVELAEVLRESMRLLRHILPASIEIIEDRPDDSDIWIRADATQIQQVLINLAVNARDAMPDGGELRISLHTEPVEAAEDAPSTGAGQTRRVVLVVSDTGEGMDEQTRARAFEPFFTTKPRSQGTGLGMSVIHAIITDHQGRIELSSTPGRGTTVTMSLPCCPPAQADRDQAPNRETEKGHGEVVIVAEDNEYVCSIMTSALRGQGYEVLQADDGRKAISLLGARRDVVRLILLDLDLPGEDGAALLAKIERIHPEVPIVMSTASIDEDFIDRLNADHTVLRKPFRISELAAVVRQAVTATRISEGAVT